MTATMLRTEADVARTLAGRAVTIEELYAACEAAGVTARDNGHAPIPGRGSDTVWRRRARNALQALKAANKAERVDDGLWVIKGERQAPQQLLLVLCDEPGALSLTLADAASFLRQTEEPYSLVIADPPYGVHRRRQEGREVDPHDRGGRLYGRNREMVVDGYVEVDEDDYGEFTHEWMAAAAEALAPRAYLAVITGTSVAWRVGHAAHDLGLNEICQIAAERRLALPTTRRPSNAHWVISVYSHATRDDKRRYFATPPELPTARSGRAYPKDVWAGAAAPAKYERRGALRYRNALPLELVDRLVRMFTPGPEVGADPWTSLVADPFLGSGQSAVVCLNRQRRFEGADLNPEALRFTAARISYEELR
ncbi:MAG TPA: DNA methyltransferase [Acidimicrobiales bacterium]|nr:DNA methyltransferase [Acidimicrobiales bacterium]